MNCRQPSAADGRTSRAAGRPGVAGAGVRGGATSRRGAERGRPAKAVRTVKAPSAGAAAARGPTHRAGLETRRRFVVQPHRVAAAGQNGRLRKESQADEPFGNGSGKFHASHRGVRLPGWRTAAHSCRMGLASAPAFRRSPIFCFGGLVACVSMPLARALLLRGTLRARDEAYCCPACARCRGEASRPLGALARASPRHGPRRGAACAAFGAVARTAAPRRRCCGSGAQQRPLASLHGTSVDAESALRLRPARLFRPRAGAQQLLGRLVAQRRGQHIRVRPACSPGVTPGRCAAALHPARRRAPAPRRLATRSANDAVGPAGARALTWRPAGATKTAKGTS